MTTFATHFSISAPADTLEFFDIDLDRDNRRFVDPYALDHFGGPAATLMRKALEAFVRQLVDLIRQGKLREAEHLCRHLREPIGTRLGYGQHQLNGRGAGTKLCKNFIAAIQQTIHLYHSGNGPFRLEDLLLSADGIDRDMISDITINVARLGLIQFTQNQCSKHGVPMQSTGQTEHYFCPVRHDWAHDHLDLPHVMNSQTGVIEPIILVPILILPETPCHSLRAFYNRIAADYLKQEVIALNHSVVQHTPNGPIVLTKDLMESPEFRPSKTLNRRVIQQYPDSLTQYRNLIAPQRFKNFIDRL